MIFKYRLGHENDDFVRLRHVPIELDKPRRYMSTAL